MPMLKYTPSPLQHKLSFRPALKTLPRHVRKIRISSFRKPTRRGYKFAHLLLKTKPEYTWHVDKETARKAKNNEANMFFKVWFRFDLSQAFAGNEGQMIIVPVRIALMNKIR